MNENCCLCICFTKLYFFDWLLVVSLVILIAGPFVFSRSVNIACRSTEKDRAHRVQRRCVCRLNIKTRRKPLKRWVILIALQFGFTFYRPQTKRLRARKIGLQYKIRKGRKQIWGRFSNPWNSNGNWMKLVLFFLLGTCALVALRTTCCAPARIWLAVIDFQNGEQQSRSGSDKKRRNRLQ